MPPKTPNYQQARRDRTRSKDEKKSEKLRRREEDAAKRKEQPAEAPEGDRTARQ